MIEAIVKQVHQASIKILKTTGIRIDDVQMLELLEKNGMTLKGKIAFFTEEDILKAISTAPENFTLEGRNSPQGNCQIGGDKTHYLAGFGAPYILENNIRREAIIDDYIKMAKLVHCKKEISINGGILVQPADIPADAFQLILLYTALLFSDKPLLGMTGNVKQQSDIMELLKIAYPGFPLMDRSVIMTLVNTTSPLVLDTNMLQTLIVCAQHRQPVIISPGPMAGTTGPISIIGNVALGNAELLAGITCSQIIAPGSPVVYGLMAPPASMQTCECDSGSPGAVCSAVLGAALARNYKVPSRGGAVPNAKETSVVGGLERMMITMGASNAGVNLMVHAAGLIDRFNCVSPEQFLIDVDIIRRVEYFKQFFKKDYTDDLSYVDCPEIDQVGTGGNFLTAPNTIHRCRTEPFFTEINTKSENNSLTENEAVLLNTRKQIDQILYDYRPPGINSKVKINMREFLEQRGVSKNILDHIDTQYDLSRLSTFSPLIGEKTHRN